MDRRIKRSIFAAIGALLMATALYFFDQYISTKLNTVEVVTINQFIPAHTVISESLITIKKEPSISVTEDMITDKKEIIGKESIVAIEQGNTIYKWQFAEPGLFPLEDEMVISLPREFYLSVPGSLRRGDQIIFTAFNMLTGDTINDLFPNDKIRVLYVKQSSNNEVVSVSEKTGADQQIIPNNSSNYEKYRFYASGSIDFEKIEFALRPEQLQIINDKFKEGYRFMIGYKESGPQKEGKDGKE